MKSKELKKLEWIVATHPDVDHIGSLIDVLNEVEVKMYWIVEKNTPQILTVGHHGVDVYKSGIYR
ncbi:MBL fold metallo-hydrolase [Alteribacillus bidgolensis]|uniref:MBL fold metallo-hydrolase n=1 Tax=Alteribacillus bidgolensis TaxID=930129 RepID=UPI000B86C518